MIEFHDASVVAPGTPGTTILHATTLSLTEQRISIIGANGSGKSTLARLINGLIAPSTGRVNISQLQSNNQGEDHRPLDTVRDSTAVRRSVGFLFTSPEAGLIMPTVVEDVSLSLRRAHRDKQTRHEAGMAALQRFGLEHLADRSVHDLSGGQQQLVALASVLATDPAILVADEPTTLLDLRNTRIVGDALFSLPQQLVLVTHDLELAARADRTLIIDDGRVAFDGDPQEAIAFYKEAATR